MEKKRQEIKQAAITGIFQYSDTHSDSQVEDKLSLLKYEGKAAERVAFSAWTRVSVTFNKTYLFSKIATRMTH